MSRHFLSLGLLTLALSSPLAAQAPRLAGRLDHAFSSITGLRELSGDRVLVSDGIDDVLVRADFAAGRLDTLGRAGQGPGEYRTPDALLPLPGGATLLVDLGNARLSVFDASGRYQESHPIAQGSPAAGGLRLVLPQAADAEGRLYFRQTGGAGAAADSAPIVRWDRARGSFDTVARVKLPSMVTRSSGGPSNRSVRQASRPYPVQDGWTVTPDGRVALIRAPRYRVDWAGPDGRVTAGSEISAKPVAVGAAEKREYLEELAATGLSVQVVSDNGNVSVRMARGGRTGEGPNPDEMEWPPDKPPFAAVLPAPDGRVWVERSVAAGAARVYDVIGPRGEAAGQVTLPLGRRLVGVGARYLYARHVAEDGVAWLERYEAR
jgi:hypothetical protein